MDDVGEDGVGRAGVKEEEKCAEEKPDPRKRKRRKEHEEDEEDGEENAGGGDDEIGTGPAALKAVADETSGEGRGDAGHEKDDAVDAGGALGSAGGMDVCEVSRHVKLDAADGEGHGGHAGGGEQVGAGF